MLSCLNAKIWNLSLINILFNFRVSISLFCFLFNIIFGACAFTHILSCIYFIVMHDKKSLDLCKYGISYICLCLYMCMYLYYFKLALKTNESRA